MERYSGEKEVFKGQPSEITHFIGATAVRGFVLNQEMLDASIALRNSVYEKLNWRNEGDPVMDQFDRHSIQLAAVDSRGDDWDVALTMRTVLYDGDSDTLGLPLEKYFPDLVLEDRRAEVSRLVSRSVLDKQAFAVPLMENLITSRILYAKSCQYVIENGFAAYALVEEPLRKALTRSGVSMDVISDKIVIPEYDDTINFVVRLDAEGTKKNLLSKLSRFVLDGSRLDVMRDYFRIIEREDSYVLESE